MVGESLTGTPPPGGGRGRGLRYLKVVLREVDRLSYGAIVLTMAAMTTLVAVQVFVRYVMGSSIDSADELSRLFFIWTIFLAIPQGVKYGIHVGIDLMVAKLGERNREKLFRLMSAAGALLMATVLYAAIVATGDKWQELMPTIDVTAAVYYIAVLICASHSLLHLIHQTLAGPAAVARDEF